MENLSKIAVILAVFFAASCSPRIVEKIQVEKVTEYRDSTVWRDTTIYVPIPLEADKVIVSMRDTARRETSVAKAVAWVDAAGFLNLGIENKKTAIPYTAKLPSRTIWTSVSNTSTQTLIKTVEVEKKLSWWQRFRLRAFWWITAALLACLIWIFRNPILTWLRRR